MSADDIAQQGDLPWPVFTYGDKVAILGDGPTLDGLICDLCGTDGAMAQWTTSPFVHDYNVTGTSTPVRYSNPWAVCADCDLALSARDREALRQHVRSTEATKDLYTTIRDQGIPGALDVVRRHLDSLHDAFWRHLGERQALGTGVALDPKNLGAGADLPLVPDWDALPDGSSFLYRWRNEGLEMVPTTDDQEAVLNEEEWRHHAERFGGTFTMFEYDGHTGYRVTGRLAAVMMRKLVESETTIEVHFHVHTPRVA